MNVQAIIREPGTALLHVAPCLRSDARVAALNWHYSRSLPSVAFTYGVWEEGRFVGAVAFSAGSRNIGRPYGLRGDEVADLCRVALAPGHQSPTSRVVAVAVRLFSRSRPALRLLVSYADPEQGHHGGIYAAMGWTYVGFQKSSGVVAWFIGGKRMHCRAVYDRFGTRGSAGVLSACSDATPIRGVRKHKYVLGLDDETRSRVRQLAQPYPKRATSIGSDAPATQAGEGGAIPTVALSGGIA